MADGGPSQARADVLDLGLVLLALASGCTDVLAFARLGGALPSAMTGNTALFGLALGRGRLADAALSLLAFLGFVLGAAVASTLRDFLRGGGLRAATFLLSLEAVLLAGFALGWLGAVHPIVGLLRDGLIVLAAAGMGIQGVVARLIDRAGISTIVFTSTLGSIVGSVTRALLRGTPHRLDNETRRQIGAYGTYFLGALIAGLALWGDVNPIGALPFLAVLGALGCRAWPQGWATRG